jgi:hypothetical protein
MYAERAKIMKTTSTDPGPASRAEAVAAVPAALDQLARRPDFDAQLSGLEPGDRLAFYGALHVGLSYAIGNAINQTALLRQGSTTKNAVPLLVKMDQLAAIILGKV